MNPGAGELGVIGRFMSDIDRARCVDEAVDVLHDVIIGLGFPQLVYGWTRTPCRVDGKWATGLCCKHGARPRGVTQLGD